MRTRSIPALLLAIGLALPACAARNQRPGNSAAVASAPQAPAQPPQPRCADRVDRAKTGGMVGSVLGTIAASLFGTPALGIAYQGAGYVMGFASGSPCARAALRAETPSKVQVEPVPVSQITEEDI